MLTTLALQQGWVTRQIDFSNAFVQAPMQRTVCVSLPAMFTDFNGMDPKDLRLLLQKSLYGLREAPKLWHDFLERDSKRQVLSLPHLTPGFTLVVEWS